VLAREIDARSYPEDEGRSGSMRHSSRRFQGDGVSASVLGIDGRRGVQKCRRILPVLRSQFHGSAIARESSTRWSSTTSFKRVQQSRGLHWPALVASR
jgi:hypothetical protein